MFIGNLRNSITREELKEHFELFGAVIEVEIKSSADGRRASFGFVVFKDPETAKVVLSNKVCIFLVEPFIYLI